MSFVCHLTFISTISTAGNVSIYGIKYPPFLRSISIIQLILSSPIQQFNNPTVQHLKNPTNLSLNISSTSDLLQTSFIKMQNTIVTLLPFLLAAVSALPAAPSMDSLAVPAASPNAAIPGNIGFIDGEPIFESAKIAKASNSATMPDPEVILAFMSKPFTLLTIDQVNGLNGESGLNDIEGPGVPGCPACSGLPPADVKEANDNLQNLAHWTDRFCAQEDLEEEIVNGHCKEWAETTMKYKGNTVFKASGCPEFAWFC
jgi:hypothetical protein